MKRVIEGMVSLILFVVFISPAEAINITLAEVQNGLAVVHGNKAEKDATITWETSDIGRTTNGGSFSFSGIVPTDCVGTLSIGADTIDVPLANCGTVSGAPAPVPKTGQTTCYDSDGNVISCAGTGQDGDLQAGVNLPVPRFTDNGNGTVRDNATGLVWLKNGSCLGNLQWVDALEAVNSLAEGNVACNLTDQSVAGDWRVPNLNELTSLLDLGTWGPALPLGHPFVGFNWSNFLTSTTLALAPEKLWLVNMDSGEVWVANKCCVNGFVAAVRGP